MARAHAPFHVALLALVSIVALGIGIFEPVLQVDSLLYNQKLTPWDSARTRSIGVLASAALALPGVYGRRHGLIVLSMIGLWGTLAYPWVRGWLYPEKHSFLVRLGRAIKRPVEDMATRIVLDYEMVNVLWGAWALLGGAAGLTVAGVLALRARQAQQPRKDKR